MSNISTTNLPFLDFCEEDSNTMEILVIKLSHLKIFRESPSFPSSFHPIKTFNVFILMSGCGCGDDKN